MQRCLSPAIHSYQDVTQVLQSVRGRGEEADGPVLFTSCPVRHIHVACHAEVFTKLIILVRISSHCTETRNGIFGHHHHLQTGNRTH